MADDKVAVFTKPIPQLAAEVKALVLKEMLDVGYSPNPSDVTSLVSGLMGIINREVLALEPEVPKSTYVDPNPPATAPKPAVAPVTPVTPAAGTPGVVPHQ
jgi:hypothetical protein